LPACVVQFMSLTYLLNATWMGITSFVALSIVIHVMLNSVCNVEVFDGRFQYIDTEWGFCLNLSRFGEPLCLMLLLCRADDVFVNILIAGTIGHSQNKNYRRHPESANSFINAVPFFHRFCNVAAPHLPELFAIWH